MKKTLFTFMDVRATEASKVIEEEGTYYMTGVVISRRNEEVSENEVELTQWRGFLYRAPALYSLGKFDMSKCNFVYVSDLNP